MGLFAVKKMTTATIEQLKLKYETEREFYSVGMAHYRNVKFSLCFYREIGGGPEILVFV